VTFLEYAQTRFFKNNTDVDKCSEFFVELLPTLYERVYSEALDIHRQFLERIINNIINRSHDGRL